MRSPAPAWARDTGTRFYRISAVAALAVAVTGFFLTYLRPMATGTFAGPSRAHVHGVFLASWLALVLTQSFLVHKRLTTHRKLGWAGHPRG